MNKLLTLIAICLAIGFLLVLAAGWANDKAANVERARGHAEAMIIRAQGQAAIERAQAAIERAEAFQLRAQGASTVIVAAIPWGILAILGILGLAIIALAFVIIARPKAPQVITREIIYLPPPNTNRRDLWQALSNHRTNVLTIPGKTKEVSE